MAQTQQISTTQEEIKLVRENIRLKILIGWMLRMVVNEDMILTAGAIENILGIAPREAREFLQQTKNLYYESSH